VVRIRAELTYADTAIDLEITRLGDVITIFSASQQFEGYGRRPAPNAKTPSRGKAAGDTGSFASAGLRV